MTTFTTMPNAVISTQYWYAVYTMPRSEKKVEHRLLEKGFQVYLPLVSTIRMWSDRKKKVKVPLIPGYVFVQSDEKTLFETLTVQGALGVIRHLGKPARIRDYEIDNLKIMQTDASHFQAIQTTDFHEGDCVQINYGPLMGLIGRYVRLKGKYRMIVGIESLGAAFEVNVPVSFLEKKGI